MFAKIRVIVEFEADLSDDPESYEGAATPQARMAKEKEYIENDGDCLIDWLTDAGAEQLQITATVNPVTTE
jgi:hypothetical protein